eukprot:1713033-Prorocentrum_lima.AAC.1
MDRDALASCTQAGLTLPQFVEQFTNLRAKIPQCSDAEALHRLLHGMAPHVRLDVDKHFSQFDYVDWQWDK